MIYIICFVFPNFDSFITFSDVDECAEGSHDCDVNAYCKNTKGSYTCTCKQTYSGNGTTCTLGREFHTYDNGNNDITALFKLK